MIQRLLLVWFLVISAAAMWWPTGIFDPFTAIPRQQLSWLIFVAMFFIGAMLLLQEVRGVARRWPAVISGTAVQYLSMPLLGYWMGKAWQLSDDNFIGIVMVGCVPGAMASNVLTLNARGNASYSVGLTTLATMLSPLVVPLALGLTLQRWDTEQIDLLWQSAFTLAWSVVLPVLLGFGLARSSASIGRVCERLGPATANLMILWVIAAVIAANRDRLMSFQFDVIGALVCVNLLGYVAGYLGGVLLRLDEPMRRALTLEVGMQNAGLGATLALALFPGRPAVAIAPALFMFGCMLSGTLLAQAWAWNDARSLAARGDAT